MWWVGSSAGPGADSKIIHHEEGEPITSQGVLPGLGLAPYTRKFLRTLYLGYPAGDEDPPLLPGWACGLQIQLRNLVAGWPLVTCVQVLR